MPFFGGGGGDYIIVGTNIKGGTNAAPAVIGDNNMALGNGALESALNADENIAIGNLALNAISTGSRNISIGHNSFPNLALGTFVTSIGGNTGAQSTGSQQSVIIGHGAFSSTIFQPHTADAAQQSVIIGTSSVRSGDVTSSVYIGFAAGQGNAPLSTNAVVIGSQAIGFDSTITIGANSLGDINSIAIGVGVIANPNSIVIGDSSHTNIQIGGINLLSVTKTYNFDIAKVRAVSGTATFSAFGVSNTVIGTASTLLFSNSSVVTANPNVYLSSTATAGASCGVSSANAACITPGSFGNGGFEFAAEFAINDSTGGVGNNGRFFVGLSGDGTAPNSNPSSWTTALAGIGSDAGDAEASIFYNVFFGTAVKLPLGVDFPIAAFGVPALWSVSLAWKPGDTVIKCAVKRKTNTATFTHNEDIPLIDSGFALFAHVWRNNAAVAAAVRLAVSGYSVKNYVGWDSPA